MTKVEVSCKDIETYNGSLSVAIDGVKVPHVTGVEYTCAHGDLPQITLTCSLPLKSVTAMLDGKYAKYEFDVAEMHEECLRQLIEQATNELAKGERVNPLPGARIFSNIVVESVCGRLKGVARTAHREPAKLARGEWKGDIQLERFDWALISLPEVPTNMGRIAIVEGLANGKQCSFVGIGRPEGELAKRIEETSK